MSTVAGATSFLTSDGSGAPKQWTGGVTNGALSSIGWSCTTNYTVTIGASLKIGHNKTKQYSSGLTATLLGVSAGVRQTTQNDSSYYIKYTEDTGSNSKVCGYANDPICTANTQEAP